MKFKNRSYEFRKWGGRVVGEGGRGRVVGEGGRGRVVVGEGGRGWGRGW